MGLLFYHGARRAAPLVAALAALAILTAMAAACSSNNETPTSDPSPTAQTSPTPTGPPTAEVSSTSVPASPTQGPGTPTSTPDSAVPTPTPLPPVWTTLDTLECVRVLTGVPVPEGPDQWIEVTGRITNPGEEPVQIGSIAPLTATFYDGQGQLIATTRGPIPVSQFEPGQTHTVEVRHLDPELPNAVSCRISVNGSDNRPIPMGGLSEAGITDLALP